MKMQHGKFTYEEIMSQGDIWARTLKNAAPQAEKLSAWLKKDFDEIIFTGCGSTHYLALTAARHWTILTKRASRGLPSSELWYYPGVNYSKQKPLLAAVSRSGETTETIQAIKAYEKLFREDCLVISCYPESSMVKDASYNLLAADAQEESIAQTRSFASMFILTQYLAGFFAMNAAYLAELHRLPLLFPNLVNRYEILIQQLAAQDKYQHFVFLGSGLNFGLASEAMLKMKEMSISVSEAFHFMEFRHGPMSMVTEKSLVIGLMSDSRKEEENKVLHDMKKLGASILAITDQASGVDADFVVELKSGISEEARGVLYLPLLQLMAFYRSIDKGLNPDQPTNLESVVRL